jgi:hypothetical protein
MSHATICFLTETLTLDEAENRVMAYLETENFFGYSDALPEQSGSLETKREKLSKFLNGWDWREAADGFLKEAGEYKDTGNLAMYGYNLVRAGELYSQSLTIGACVFNIDAGDYSIPVDEKGWQLIAVGFHY